MGEVYRARDARLARDVAVKILSSQHAPTPEARERFEREAKTVSRLSHPHICVLHDVGREGDTEYLVMELLEGENLADRLGRGPLPPEQAIRFGAEIAGALEAAHRAGIVHRDLKPGNVMLTKSGVKLLDFGLARGFEAPSAASLTGMPTLGRDLTAEGAVVGTVAYMAPEQLEGRPTDARTDIFALGAVLYEMLTGRKAFSGASSATLISAILTTDPPAVSSLAPASPPGLDRLVATCLAKDPDDRWGSAHDVELQLRSIAGGSSGSNAQVLVGAVRKSAWRSRVPWAVAAVCAAAAAVSLRNVLAAKRPIAPLVRFTIAPPEGGAFEGDTVENSILALSPDGSVLAFVASGREGGPHVWVRPISALEPRPVSGTEGARTVFWSPDSRTIGFAAGNQLRRVGLEGGASVAICDVPPGIGLSASWGSAGEIVFASVQGEAVFRVAAAGGSPVRVVEPDPSRQEGRLNWPWFLPDGRRFLYLARRFPGASSVMLYEPGRPPRAIMAEASRAQYMDTGFLVFARDATLLARRFDEKSGTVTGEAIPVAPHVRYFASSGYAAFAVSRTGSVALQSRADVSRLVWFDRSGRQLGVLGPPGLYLNVRISPQANRVFFVRARPATGSFGIWSADLERAAEAPVSPGPDTEIDPILLPDARTLIYSAVRGRSPQLVREDLATGKVENLLPFETFQSAEDVSPDGRTLLFLQRGERGLFDLWTLALSGGAKPVSFVKTGVNETSARFSPDGRYVAYVSNESAGNAIDIAPYPGPGERVRVSARGAGALRWSRAGDLLFVSDDRHLVSVPIRTSPSLEIGKPVDLFVLPEKSVWEDFDVSPDGKRLLAVVPEVNADELPLDVVVNWAPAAAR